jgi:hypothetical protein
MSHLNNVFLALKWCHQVKVLLHKISTKQHLPIQTTDLDVDTMWVEDKTSWLFTCSVCTYSSQTVDQKLSLHTHLEYLLKVKFYIFSFPLYSQQFTVLFVLLEILTQSKENASLQLFCVPTTSISPIAHIVLMYLMLSHKPRKASKHLSRKTLQILQ